MNKYGITSKAAEATKSIFTCMITCILALVVIFAGLVMVDAYKRYKFRPPPELVSQVQQPSEPARIELEGENDGMTFEDCPEPNDIRTKTTGYCAKSCCCGEYADGFTASGVPAVGLIAAAPPDMPFGTVLEIPGYGRCRVQDRGGAIIGNRLDVLFTDKGSVSGHQRALNWGVQYLEVRIVE